MTLETRLRLSVIQNELFALAESLDVKTARIVIYAARVLNLLKGSPS